MTGTSTPLPSTIAQDSSNVEQVIQTSSVYQATATAAAMGSFWIEKPGKLRTLRLYVGNNLGTAGGTTVKLARTPAATGVTADISGATITAAYNATDATDMVPIGLDTEVLPGDRIDFICSAVSTTTPSTGVVAQCSVVARSLTQAF